MPIIGKIEIELGAIANHPLVEELAASKLMEGSFTDGRLILPQSPGWYVPDPVVFEPVVERGAASVGVRQGDRFYTFNGRIESFRAFEIHQVLSLLPYPCVLRDYCYIGASVAPVQDPDGFFYTTRTGRLTLYPPQNPGRQGGRTVYYDPMEFRFDQA